MFRFSEVDGLPTVVRGFAYGGAQALTFGNAEQLGFEPTSDELESSTFESAANVGNVAASVAVAKPGASGAGTSISSGGSGAAAVAISGEGALATAGAQAAAVAGGTAGGIAIAESTGSGSGPRTRARQFNEYLDDVEKQTRRKLTPEQRKRTSKLFKETDGKKIDRNTYLQRKGEFDSQRDQLIAEWEKMTGKKWPKYEKDIVNPVTGKTSRKAGWNYDAHHLVELDRGGVNKWWNLHPARGPAQHQRGIHRAGGPLQRLHQ